MTNKEIQETIIACIDYAAENEKYPKDILKEVYQYIDKWYNQYDMADQINHVWAMLKCTQDELSKANERVMYYRIKFDSIDKIMRE